MSIFPSSSGEVKVYSISSDPTATGVGKTVIPLNLDSAERDSSWSCIKDVRNECEVESPALWLLL